MDKYGKSEAKKEWTVVALCLIAYTAVYIGRKTLSACCDPMISDGIIDARTGGLANTMFLVSYALGQIANGFLGDKLNPKYMLSLGLLGEGITVFLMGVCSKPYQIITIWFFCGAFCSMLWSPVVRAISVWTGEKTRVTAGASLTVPVPVGKIICLLICSALIKVSSWRTAFIVNGSIVAFASVAVFVGFSLLSGYTKRAEKINLAHLPNDVDAEDAENGAAKGAKAVIRMFFGTGLLAAALVILFNGVLKDGLDYWIPTVLGNAFVGDPSTADLIGVILPIVDIFGAFAAKLLFTKFFDNELTVSGILFGASMVSLGVVFAIMTFVTSNGSIFVALIAAVFMAISSASMLGASTMLLTYIPLRYSRAGRASTVTGTLNSVSYLAASLSGVMIGSTVETSGWNVTFIAFTVVALVGGIICFVCAPLWKRGIDRIGK